MNADFADFVLYQRSSAKICALFFDFLSSNNSIVVSRLCEPLVMPPPPDSRAAARAI